MNSTDKEESTSSRSTFSQNQKTDLTFDVRLYDGQATFFGDTSCYCGTIKYFEKNVKDIKIWHGFCSMYFID